MKKDGGDTVEEKKDGSEGAEEKKGGSNLKTRLSENAIACAEVAATPFGDKGHPQFGREMSVANEEHHDKHKQ